MTDLTGLDLNLLLALERLLARQSVTLAAKELGLSQPATSRALGRLREVLGDPLLVKVGRELVPTERGRALLGPATEALAAAARVFAPPARFDPQSARGELAIALGDEAQHAFVPALVAALAKAAPGLDLRVHRLSEATVEDGRRGRIDLALSPDLNPLPKVAGRVDLSDFVLRRVYRRRFVVAARTGRFSAPPDLDAYCAASHVIVSFEGGGRGFVDDLLAAGGRQRRVAVAVTSFPAALRVVATTDLIATVPAELALADEHGLSAWAPPLHLPELDVSLVWHPRQTNDPRHRFLRELVARAVTERLLGLEGSGQAPAGA